VRKHNWKRAPERWVIVACWPAQTYTHVSAIPVADRGATPVAATLGAMATGAILGWSSSAQSMLETDGQLPFPVSSQDTQTFSSVFGIGAALGALPAGYVSGTFGRRTGMMLCEGFLLAGWAMLVLSTSVWMLSWGRVLQGVGAGALCAVVPSYVGEIAEPRTRGECE